MRLFMLIILLTGTIGPEAYGQACSGSEYDEVARLSDGALDDFANPLGGGGVTFNQMCKGILQLSLVHLAAESEFYNGRVVNVHGLYRHPSMLNFSRSPEGRELAVWIDPAAGCMIEWIGWDDRDDSKREPCTTENLESVDGKWVAVWGRYGTGGYGHMGVVYSALEETMFILVYNPLQQD